MLSADEERLLLLIEASMWLQDPKFARGLQQGRPCRPREFRRFDYVVLVPLLWALTIVGVGVGFVRALFS